VTPHRSCVNITVDAPFLLRGAGSRDGGLPVSSLLQLDIHMTGWGGAGTGWVSTGSTPVTSSSCKHLVWFSWRSFFFVPLLWKNRKKHTFERRSFLVQLAAALCILLWGFLSCYFHSFCDRRERKKKMGFKIYNPVRNVSSLWMFDPHSAE